MAIIFEDSIATQGSIYSKDLQERRLNIRYSIPSYDFNDKTGLLVIVGGYGADMSSRVFQHMMESFPDSYNLIVMQCDYFGFKFLNSIVDDAFRESVLNSPIDDSNEMICANYPLSESLNEFNDMGIMQATDINTATLFMMSKFECLKNNPIILFGSSHGAYISHLSNILYPNLYSLIIDISGYITPYYLTHDRLYYLGKSKYGQGCIAIFSYLISNSPELQYSNMLYDLRYCYRFVDSKCKTLAFHGDSDWMVDYKEKEAFVNSIPNSHFVLFTKDNVDGEIVKNTDHALGLDFLKFFDSFMPTISNLVLGDKPGPLESEVWISNLLHISYNNKYPVMELL